MKRPVRQTNFLGGELNPLLLGRTDLAVYARGLRTCRNFFPGKYGSAFSRPGSAYLGTTKDPAEAAARLLPFNSSDTDAWALELGPGYIRFWNKDGRLAGNVNDPVYEITTSYVAAHLRALKYAQTGDVLTIARKGYAAMELRRLADWTLAALTELAAEAVAAGIAAAGAGALSDPASTLLFRTAYNAVFTAAVFGAPQDLVFAEASGVNDGAAVLPAAPIAFYGASYNAGFMDVVGVDLPGTPRWTFTAALFARPAPYYDPASTAGSYPVIASPLPTVDATHPASEWIYLGTQAVQETLTGRIFETLPRRLTSSWDENAAHAPVALPNDKLALFPDQPVRLVRGAHSALGTDAANTANATYRVIEDRYYRGRGDPSGKGIGLFGFIGATTTGEFLDDGAEPNYAKQPPRGTNPFLTYDSAGALSSVESPLAVAFFQDRRVFGGTYLRPTGLFASAKGNYTDHDRHVFQLAGESLLFELAARRYEEVVHLVSHEKLLVHTRSSAWSFSGASGASLDFNSVEARVIDEDGASDAVPLIVDGAVLFGRAMGAGVRALVSDAGGNYRGADITYHADHLFIGNGVDFDVFGASRALVDWTHARVPWDLVWAVREDGMLLSLTYKNGDAGWARHDSFTLNGSPARYQSVCAIPEGQEHAVYAIVARALGGTWTTCVERMASRVRRGVAGDDCAVDCCVKYSGAPPPLIAGLDHLWGEQVYVIAKGNPPQGPLTVKKQGPVYYVELTDALEPNDGADVVAYVGLGFVADLEPLDVASTDARMHQKTVTAVGLELTDSRGVWAGPDFSDKELVPVQDRDADSSYSAPVPETRLFRVNIRGSWKEHGRVAIRQKLPLPVTVTGLIREVDFGDR